jgi:repressor LexA
MLGILLAMSGELTQKQDAVFLFIKAFILKHGFPPSIREIGLHFQIAPPSVLSHLKAIERKGFIRRHPLKPRCLEILKPEQHKAA